MSFGNWIKRRRKALDLTQEELGQRVGCSTSAIFKIESDGRRPSRQLAELLAKHLEITPDQYPLFLKVARQEKGVGSLDEVPPLTGFEHPPEPLQRISSLPVFPTPFVGREHEIDIVTNQLRDPACRLLTLTGPGGVGKTRLAVEVARKLEAVFPDGVAFLSMGPVDQPESIIPTLADTLGIVFSGPADPKLQVINGLQRKNILLVFDNMEHLIGGSDILGEILQQAPSIKMLLTSREQIYSQWEWIFEVQGLPVPEEASANTLETNSAAILFLQRARQTAHHLPLSPEEASALVRICKLVDGLPLAIELAAAWVRVMSFREIAQELERNTNLLESNLYDVPARHRSIKVVFDHSWGFLNPDERQVLMRLSVFLGGFTRQAAQTVAGASLQMLSALVGKSLLHYNKVADRYDFHELIRQYSLGRLREEASGENDALEKHSSYYAGLLEALETPLKSAEQIQASAQIRLETTNWTAAWQWAVQNQRFDLLRMMTPCLYWYYEIHGFFAEAHSSYHYAVSELRPSTPADYSTFAFLVNQYGWFEFRTGDLEQALELFAESLELARSCTDQEILYHIHINWGYLALLNGDHARAKELTQQSLTNAQRLNSQWHIAISITILGIVEYQQGNLEEAYRQLTDSLNIWRSVGDPRGLIFCMLYLSSAALALGDIGKVESILHESNAMAVQKMDRWALAFGMDLLGQVDMLKSDYEKAQTLFRQSLAISNEIEDKWASTQTLIHLGSALASLGIHEEAKSLFQEAYLNSQQSKWTPTILEALIAFVSLDQELAPETRLAVTLSVLAHPAISPSVHQNAERLCERLSSSLSAPEIESARVQSTSLDPEVWDQNILRAPGNHQPGEQASTGK